MSRELLKRALDFIAPHQWEAEDKRACYALAEEIETELSKPDPEPVAWINGDELDSLETCGMRFATCRNTADGWRKTPLYRIPPDQSAQIAELIAQRSMQEEIIKSAYARCRELEEQLAELQAKRKPLTDDTIKISYSKALEDSYYEDVDWGITPTKKLNIVKFARAVENAHGIGS